MGGRMRDILITPLPPIKRVDEEGREVEEEVRAMKKLVDEITDGFREVKNALDVIGMNFAYTVEVTDTGSADTEFTVEHNFGVVPDGYLVSYQDQAGYIYDGDTAWDATNIYLKASVANMHVKILVYTSTN